MMTSANHMMIVEMSKAVVICTLSFLYSKLLVDVLWKGHLRTVKSRILPQQKCNFGSPELRAKVSFFLQAQSSPSLLRTLPAMLSRQTAARK